MIEALLLLADQSSTTNTLLTFLLGGGLVGAIGALFRGVQGMRSGTRAREREAIDDLGKWREQEHDARILAEKDAQFWQRWCNHYIGQLMRNNIDPKPAPDTLSSPSDKKRGEGNGQGRSRRSRESGVS